MCEGMSVEGFIFIIIIFLISYKTVTMNEGKGNQNWHQNVKFHEHVKLEENQSVNFPMQSFFRVCVCVCVCVCVWGGGGVFLTKLCK